MGISPDLLIYLFIYTIFQEDDIEQQNIETQKYRKDII